MNITQAVQFLQEMRAAKTGQTQAPQPQGQGAGQSKAQKAQNMQRLGSKNLGGATAAQTADALSKAGEGNHLHQFNEKQWRNKRHLLKN